MVIAVVAAAAAFAAPQTPVAAPPRRVLRHYCSPSGDVCYGTAVRRGALYLEINTIERYFARYRLCVRPPTGTTTCRTFPIRRTGRIYGSAVRWYRTFPNRGPGIYRVTWRLGSQPLGPGLRFRLPLASP
jgi:hypothetical protein